MLLMYEGSPSWATGFNILIALLSLLITLGIALLILMSKRREEIHSTETKRADANEGLVKVRDTELADCNKRCEKCNEELEDVTSEYRAITSIHVKDLLAYWQTRDAEMAEKDELKRQIRVLKLRVGDDV